MNPMQYNKPSKALPDSRRKWLPGEKITSLDGLVQAMEAKKYIFVAGRRAGYHWSVIGNWPLRLVRRYIQAGRFYCGKRNENIPFRWSVFRDTRAKFPFTVFCDELGFYSTIKLKDQKAIARDLRQITATRSGIHNPKLELVYPFEA